MRFHHLLPLAAAASALVIPEDRVFAEIPIESNTASHTGDLLKGLKESAEHVAETSKSVLDRALEAGSAAYDDVKSFARDAHDWAEDVSTDADESDSVWQAPDLSDRPHHRPHHKKPNQTVYELIAGSKYTTKLAKLVSEDEELVKILNGTAANYTVFAPTDRAFEKIPKHHKKPSKEFIRAVLSYHVSPEFYPAGRVLATHTIPTLYKSDSLGPEPLPQRLSVAAGLKGLTLNYYSRIIAINIFGTNGVIHGVDTLIIPPPNALDIIELLPGSFSTLSLGIEKTGLGDTLNTSDTKGGTFFAPSNFAFKKLGPKINLFLFSKYGQKYLKALLKYHVVPEQTLYSDAIYKGEEEALNTNIPKGLFHIDLPTLLENRYLSVDVARYGPFITIKINGFSTVVAHDGPANNGVIQTVGDVLIPPKKLAGQGELSFWNGEEMSVEELQDRLDPYVEEEDWAEL